MHSLCGVESEEMDINIKRKKRLIWILFICLVISSIVLVVLMNLGVLGTNIVIRPSAFMHEENAEQLSFDDYQQMNEDFRFIIIFKDRSLPVVQSSDNEDYVRRSISKRKDSMGTPMIDMNSVGSYNQIIYSHSSSNNNYMLTEFKNKEWIKENQVFIVEYAGSKETYQMISYYKVDWDVEPDFSMLETMFLTPEDLTAHLQTQAEKSLINFGEYQYAGEQEFITLVTCDMTKENGRYIVVAVKLE